MKKTLAAFIGVAMLLPVVAAGDELTQIIQQDLTSLGYDPGNVDGKQTVALVVAISKFQAEHDLEVTGEVSPQLAGIIKSKISQKASGGASAAPATVAASAPTRDPLELQAAQQACLQRKMTEAQESSQRKRGFARLARAVTRTASRLGADGVSRDVAALSSDVYAAGAIADDFAGAAEDLGLTETDIDECRNP